MERHREALDICKQLSEAGYPTMLAGGCVRDHLLGKQPKDYDLATAATPDQAMAFFKERGQRIVPTGIEHGTISLITDQQALEITTLRKDVACDGRHAEVAYSTSFEEDALRRDFTINALFEDANGTIHDYVGGQEDIQQQRLRFVGEPCERIREDYLRILRYFRFLGRLNWQAEDDQLSAIAAEKEGLAQISAERIFNELNQTLATKGVAESLSWMKETGVLRQLFPKMDMARIPLIGRMLRDMPKTPSAWRWFMLLYLGQTAINASERGQQMEALRFTRKEKKAVLAIEKLIKLSAQVHPAACYLLRMHRDGFEALSELLEFIEAHKALLQVTLPRLLKPIAVGMAQNPQVPIPGDLLMKAPPQDRGTLVDLAKIYWYLGACRDKNDLCAILKKPKYYSRLLNCDDPVRLANLFC